MWPANIGDAGWLISWGWLSLFCEHWQFQIWADEVGYKPHNQQKSRQKHLQLWINVKTLFSCWYRSIFPIGSVMNTRSQRCSMLSPRSTHTHTHRHTLTTLHKVMRQIWQCWSQTAVKLGFLIPKVDPRIPVQSPAILALPLTHHLWQLSLTDTGSEIRYQMGRKHTCIHTHSHMGERRNKKVKHWDKRYTKEVHEETDRKADRWWCSIFIW